jgi:hypothetical protein
MKIHLQFDKLASVLIMSSERQKVSLKKNACLKNFIFTKQNESDELESVLVLLRTLKIKFQVMGMINIEKSALCDVSYKRF